MNYHFSNLSTNSIRTLSKETWCRVLNLARFYGWQPMGTLPPFLHNLRKPTYTDESNRMWDGTYLRNEGQTVRGEDALALAIALRMSLDDIPDQNPERDLDMEDDQPDWLSPDEKALVENGLEDMNFEEDTPEELPLGILSFEYFAGDGKENLVEFIHFCMLGEFVIM